MRASVVVAGETLVQPLVALLRAMDVDDVWVLQGDLGDRYMLDPAPDFVLGVLTDEETSSTTSPKPFSNNDVALRVGLAAGRGIPVLVVAPPPVQAVSPDPLITVVACEAEGYSALAEHVWAFTETLDISPSESATASSGRRLKNADEYLMALDQLEWGSREFSREFERLMGRLLMDAGAAAVVSESQFAPEDRVDIAFMPSRRSPDIVLVELKAGRLTEKRLSEAEEQLQSFVIERRAKYGMVLYHDVEGKPHRSRLTKPLILRMSARQLIEKLADSPLAKVLDDAVAEAVGRM